MTKPRTFESQFERKHDDKSRVVFPKEHVRNLKEHYGSLKVVVVQQDDFLKVVPEENWLVQEEVIKQQYSIQKADEILASAHKTTIQKNGRLQIIHEDFRKGAKKNAAKLEIIGKGTYIQIRWLDERGQMKLPFIGLEKLSAQKDAAERKSGPGRPVKQGQIVEIPIDDITLPAGNDLTRANLESDDKTKQLIQSLKDDSQQFPVFLSGTAKPHDILDGTRRIYCLKKLGVKIVYAIVFPKMSKKEAQKLAFIDKIEQHSASDGDLLLMVAKLKNSGFRTDEIATLIRRKERTAQRLIKVAEAPGPIREKIVDGKLSISAAYEMLTKGIPLEKKFASERPSVREIQRYAKGEQHHDQRRKGGGIKDFQNGGFAMSVHYTPDVSQEQKKEMAHLLKEALAKLELT